MVSCQKENARHFIVLKLEKYLMRTLLTLSSSCLYTDHITEMVDCNMMLLEQPMVPFSGESRYMTHLWVSGNVEPREQLCHSYLSQAITSGFPVWADPFYPQEIKNRIRAALKVLPLREEHVLVQFWSPCVAGKNLLLTTIDQPFGLGVVSEELWSYRRDSEHKAYLLEQEGLSPPARVYMHGLPEWTSDLTNYNTKDFPQQDCAIRYNLHGYLALPVSDPITELRVGVLELLTCSKLEDFTHEVEHIHQALKKVNLTSPQAFEGFDGRLTVNVSNGRGKNESDKLFGILKHVCDTHGLPLAQTWTLSPSTTYFAHEKFLEMSCNCFKTSCLGKVCMSTASPSYVRDVNMWSFTTASKRHHLEMSRGVAGRAMSSRGSCFCGDVTQLDKEEYPLVHYARISKLTGCFAIYLQSVEDNNDYVLEFFLHINDSIHVMNLVHTLKQSIEADSGFELGDVSTLEIIGPPIRLSQNERGSSDSDSVVTDAFESDYENVSMETVSDNFASMVMVNVTFNNSIKQFAFSLFGKLSELEKKVATMFKLDCQRFKLEYVDEDGDLIRVCVNDDLEFARFASGGDSSMNLICSICAATAAAV